MGSGDSSGLRRRILISVLWLCLALARSATDEVTEAPSSAAAASTEAPRNCNSPAIEEFPRDLFTQEQRIEGAIAVHIAASVYLIMALAVICDDYFVPVLEIICEKLNLKPDVAGATFMAAGKKIQSAGFINSLIWTTLQARAPRSFSPMSWAPS